MRLVRDLERRLEQLVEGFAGRVFRGQLHPVELAAHLVRTADLSTFETVSGDATANVYTLRTNPRDLESPALPAALQQELAAVVEETARERGWRLEGPVQVRLETDEAVAPGTVECRGEVVPGSLDAWGILAGPVHLELRHNRESIGRSESCDVVVDDPHVSRRHALIWREGAGVWIEDSGSINGTLVNGARVDRATPLAPGTTVAFGRTTFVFRMV